ncbi:MAG: hypothetical protein LBM08_05430 [Dysgonamonadaceae bacterium]|nr:hypothetical protein [Dysgonamonadaceae bacterium]
MKEFFFFKLALVWALTGFTFFFAGAKDVYLSADGQDTNGGTSPSDAVATLAKAYQLIGNQTGTIYIGGEVDGHTGIAAIDANGLPFLGTSYTLSIEGIDGTAPKITGDRTVRMFRLRADMELKLKNLTLSGTPGDTATFDGGCIQMQGGSLQADHVTFENFTTANYGAVIHTASVSAEKPEMTFTNCIFRNNSATGNSGYGSVLRIADYSTDAGNPRANAKVHFENCAFVNNSALYGTFFFRTANVAAPYPEITFVNSTFTANSNGNGNSGCLTVYSGNQTVNVINCTIKDNTASHGVRATAAGATVNIRNSILEGNAPNDLREDNGPTINIANSLIFSENNNDYTRPAAYTSTNQLLNAFDDATGSFTPKFASLAIGYGDRQYLEALNISSDQLGNTRLFENGKVDAGAVEVGESAIWVSESGDNDNDGTENLPVLTLKKAFSFFTANQTGTIYVSGTVAADTEGNGLDLNGVNLTVKGMEGTDAEVTGDSIRLFNVRNNAVLTLKNLHLSGNPEKSLVGQGGCISFAGGGSLFAENTVFENFSTAFNPVNEANPNNDTSGAGVIFLNQFNASSTNPILSFKNCQFRNNSTTGQWGGGVMRVQDFGTVANPQVYFENCGFYGNTTTRMGGSVIFLRAGGAANSGISFVNSTITASGAGGNGVIYPYGGSYITLNIVNSTIKDNATRGIYLYQTAFPELNIYNSVMEGNTGNDIYYNDKAAEPGTFNISHSLLDNTNWVNVDAAPYTKPDEYTAGTLFEALDEATISFTPIAGSLAINYGDAQYLTALDIDYDQLNSPRKFVEKQDDLCDAGAIERPVVDNPPPTGLKPAKAANIDNPVVRTQYYTLMGTEIAQPNLHGVYLLKKVRASGQIEVTSIIIK